MNSPTPARDRAPGETAGSPQRPARALVGPVLNFDLSAEVNLLREEASWQHGDRNARTIVQEGDLRISVVVLKQGAELREHRTAGAVSVQTLTGRLRLRAAGESYDLQAGSLLVLDHSIPHEVEALEQSAFLLTVALPHSTG